MERGNTILEHVETCVSKLRASSGSSFLELELVGSAGRGSWHPGSDVDVLAVLNDAADPVRGLRGLRSSLAPLAAHLDLAIVSDSYFLPILSCCGDVSGVIHLILYSGRRSVAVSPHYSVLARHTAAWSLPNVSLNELSRVLAAQGVLKAWVMTSMNTLPPKLARQFLALQERAIEKWLSPIELLPEEGLRQLATFIREDTADDHGWRSDR